MTNYRPFILRRTTDGDVLRADDAADTWIALLRWGARVVLPEEVAGTGLITVPYHYDAAIITVQVPKTVDWEQAVLVRGGFGFPTTPQDGIQVWYTDTKPIDTDTSQQVIDRPLTEDNWYYYSLFLWIGGQWVSSAIADVLVPKNHHHSEAIFGYIPPFYQRVDNENAVDGRNGALRLFASVVGYDMDYTRSLADGVLNLYNVDRAPWRLLRYLGENQGFPYDGVLGAARYRSIIEQLDDLNGMRGTALGLENLITAATDYQCDAVLGKNIMLTVDDSEFVGGGPYYPSDPEYASTGVGLWSNLTSTTLLGTIEGPTATSGVTPDDVHESLFLKGTDPLVLPPNGRGYLNIQKTDHVDTVLAAGVTDDGTQPVFRAIPVQAGALYDFQCDIKRSSSVAESDVLLVILWFGVGGLTSDWISNTVGPNIPDSPDGTAWFHFDVQGFAPSTTSTVVPPATDDAYYAVPVIWWRDPTAAAQPFPANGRHLAGVMFSKIESEGAAVQPLSPDFLLTLGVDTKKIGHFPPPTQSYYIGDEI